MNKLTHRAVQADRWGRPFAKQLKAFATLMLMSLTITSAAAAPEDEVQTMFDRFVAAQNAHDIKAVESLLLASPDFLWVTRGTAIWGHDAALKRFAALYEGTWTLEPETSKLKSFSSEVELPTYMFRSSSELEHLGNQPSKPGFS